MLKSGIPKLDELLNGGIKTNSSVLIYSVPGIKNVEFAQQILHTGLQDGNHGLYFINNKNPSVVKQSIKNYDWDLETFEKKGTFVFLDAYSGLLSMNSDEDFFS